MNCTSCGQENPTGARFCNRCGAGLTPPPGQVIEPVGLPDTSSSFVGRRREMEELTAALKDTISGQGRIVMLVGEPGIGKTRTAQELAAFATSTGALVL
ncbi:MAG: AAA family ATPase, partial [Dehalococcoidia bacterium]